MMRATMRRIMTTMARERSVKASLVKLSPMMAQELLSCLLLTKETNVQERTGKE